MSKKLWIDIAERTAWTALQAFAASVVVLGVSWDSVKVSAGAALFAVCKGLAAGQIGDDHTAAALPSSVDELSSS